MTLHITVHLSNGKIETWSVPSGTLISSILKNYSPGDISRFTAITR